MAQEADIAFKNSLVDKETLVQMINDGEFLIVAAEEDVLTSLPSGNWIGGTIPYFMTNDGGTVSRDKIYVNILTGISPHRAPRMTLYDTNSISRIAQEAPEHGFTILILPAMSDVHAKYAENAPDFPDMYFSPIIGWVSGTHLDDLGTKKAKACFGPASGMMVEQQAVAMHIPIPEHQLANVNIINLFSQGDGPVITFDKTSFSVGECKIDGVTKNLAEYIKQENIDTKLPLVADYSGVMVNASIQNVDSTNNEVSLYAPVFTDVPYRFAKPIDNYVQSFEKALPASESENVAFSCNCILNFLYSELEGKKTRDITGPVTFGEVGYQLLNQTMVYLTLGSSMK
ncbi:DUF6976 family protein [Agarilytica rhodophyticola]|uniref:DUF6976 family protein n=1 Tax=Agarilytica rhodophyticola TaxID=1737490 RepID=UPI000B3462E2|nr:hypothetical protein [Agarilytica rhodophyticola]